MPISLQLIMLEWGNRKKTMIRWVLLKQFLCLKTDKDLLALNYQTEQGKFLQNLNSLQRKRIKSTMKSWSI